MDTKKSLHLWSDGAYRAYLEHDKSCVYLLKVYGTAGKDRGVRQWFRLDHTDKRIPKKIYVRFLDAILLHNLMCQD